MLLSIVIPVYNVEEYIERCVKSCIEQDVPLSDYEIIIVDDGTPDHSMNVVESFLNNYTNIIVIHRNNGGLSAARNTGIDNAHGDYIMFLDSDDWIAEKCLAKIFRQLKEEHPDILAICAANMIGDKPVRRFSHEGKLPMSGIEVMRSRMSPCAPFSITSRKLLNDKQLRFFEGIYHEDSEFTPRLYYYAEKVSFMNDIIYYVYQNPESITRKPNPKKIFDVIGVVCPHLHDFSKNLSKEDKQVFSNRISTDINTVLSHCCEYSDSQIKEVNKLCYSNRYLFEHLKRANYLKYRIEGHLFSLFPSHVAQIYNLLQKVKF